MVSASEIADILLETDDHRALRQLRRRPRRLSIRSEANPRGVWAFGPGFPPKGAAFGSLTHLVQSLQRYQRVPSGTKPKDVLNQLITDGASIVEKKHPGDVVVYSRKLPIKVDEDTSNYVKAYLGLGDNEQIVHRQSLDDASGKTVSVRYLLHGTKEKPEAQAARQPEAEPEEFAERPAYQVNQVSQAKSTLGFTYDTRFTEQGCAVAAVHPGEPMALSGIQAGDVIRAARYTNSDTGEEVERRIGSYNSMVNMLSAADPSRYIVLTVQRGDKWHSFPMLARPIGSNLPPSTEIHIPAEEVQRYSKQLDEI